MTVILPQPTTAQIGMTGSAGDEPPPVLYLLHGLSDDDTTWVRRTSIERYAAPLGLAVVMPAGHRSFYADEALGGAYWTFLTEELPSLVHRFFRVSNRPADTFVAGLSMGGYGALKWALRHPDRVAAAASLSGAVDLSAIAAGFDWPEDPQMFRRLFPDGPVPPADDLFALVSAADPTALPALWLGCGECGSGVRQQPPARRGLWGGRHRPDHVLGGGRRTRLGAVGPGDPARARLAADPPERRRLGFQHVPKHPTLEQF